MSTLPLSDFVMYPLEELPVAQPSCPPLPQSIINPTDDLTIADKPLQKVIGTPYQHNKLRSIELLLQMVLLQVVPFECRFSCVIDNKGGLN